MLDNLLEIEIAYSMLKVGDDKAKDPIDIHYENLKTSIQVLLRDLCYYCYIHRDRKKKQPAVFST